MTRRGGPRRPGRRANTTPAHSCDIEVNWKIKNLIKLWKHKMPLTALNLVWNYVVWKFEIEIITYIGTSLIAGTWKYSPSPNLYLLTTTFPIIMMHLIWWHQTTQLGETLSSCQWFTCNETQLKTLNEWKASKHFKAMNTTLVFWCKLRQRFEASHLGKSNTSSEASV